LVSKVGSICTPKTCNSIHAVVETAKLRDRMFAFKWTTSD